MTVTAYILLNVDMTAHKAVYESIKAMEETLEIHMIFGAFDIIVKAQFEHNNQLSAFVVDKLKTLDGVIETQTNLCASVD